MILPRFSIRELLLITAVVALGFPYVYDVGQKVILPQYEFTISQSELLEWIQTVDGTAEALTNGFAGNELESEVEIVIEFNPPGYGNINAIKEGIISKLKSEGWTLRSHGYGAGINLDFHFHKGPSRYRLYVIEYGSRGFTPQKPRVARTYRIIAIHDSHPSMP